MLQKIDGYLNKPDLSGQEFEYLLMFDEQTDRWEVMCWQLHRGDCEEDDEWEHCWTVNGVTISYRDGNPNFPIIEPFTEQTARAEFERWRQCPHMDN